MDNPTPKQQRRLAAQRRRWHNVLLAGIFLLIIVLFAIINLCTKNREFSDTENRSLAQKPAFSLTALADGSYFSGLTDYYNDQFFTRDGWISLKLKEDSLLGRKESGGVYLGKNGYLIGAPDTPDEAALQHTAEAIRQFASQYPDISMQMMLVPGAASILAEYLPNNAPVRNQQQDIADTAALLGDSVRQIDVSNMLSAHAAEDIYYKTDHHWTSLGARYAFEAASASLGISEPVSNYDVYTVATDFEGTLASKSGSHSQTDTVQIFIPQGKDVEYYVTYSDSQEKVCSMYQSACLEDKDKYTVFFGGNHPLLEIRTTANNGRSILIFKDSYANCFIQFLTPYFENIVLIDPRYYYDSVELVMNSYGITDVLFLYSANTFLTDTSLADVLSSGTQPAEMPAASDPVPTGNSAEDSAMDTPESGDSTGGQTVLQPPTQNTGSASDDENG